MKIVISIILSSFLILLSGCNSNPNHPRLVQLNKTLSAGQVGCGANQIKISEATNDYTSRSWVATCQDKRFVCTDYLGAWGYSNTICTPERK